MATSVQRLEGVYDLDRVHSTVQFAVGHAGVSTFRASFGQVDARLVVGDDAMELEARAAVESVSIADPPEFREHVVRGEDFFAADAHPLIIFRSTSVELGDEGRAVVSGDLTFRGVSQPVTADGTYREPTDDPFGTTRVGLELHATIDRRQWGMNWQLPLPNGGDALGWDVAITAQLELTKAE